MLDRLESGFENALPDGLQVLLTLLELAGSPGDQCRRGHRVGIWGRNEERSLGEIERKERFDAVNHKIGREAGRPEYGHSLGPKDRVSCDVPARLPPLGSFNDGLPDIVMTPFA